MPSKLLDTPVISTLYHMVFTGIQHYHFVYSSGFCALKSAIKNMGFVLGQETRICKEIDQYDRRGNSF